nr:MAG TPA: hypothetical protein [Caudoviricetes sp.]
MSVREDSQRQQRPHGWQKAQGVRLPCGRQVTNNLYL